MAKAIFGGIEAGGTKFCCAIGDADGNIIKSMTTPTCSPAITIQEAIQFFQTIHKETPLTAIGIGSFGPIDLDINSKTYGYITTPPKSGWQNFDFVGAVKSAFNLPIGFDTDVNGAALGEYRFGAGQGLDTFLYVTVGTGIGVGGMMSGQLMHGLIHPEMGHIFIPHDKERDPFAGICPFHGDCLEGLASGPAMMKRWKIKSALDLPVDHPGWDLEADYLGLAFANYIMTLSPQRIIVGGGVMKQKNLIAKIRPRVLKMLNGYIKSDKIIQDINNYIVAPRLRDNAGICGAIALAEMVCKRSINEQS